MDVFTLQNHRVASFQRTCQNEPRSKATDFGVFKDSEYLAQQKRISNVICLEFKSPQQVPEDAEDHP